MAKGRWMSTEQWDQDELREMGKKEGSGVSVGKEK